MVGTGLASRRRGYRRGQSAVLFGLAALVIVACAIGPLYERAVEQATVRSTLGTADRTSRSLVISVDPGVAARAVGPRGAAARLFGRPIADAEVDAAILHTDPPLYTTLAYRDGECAHLSLAAGRCPKGDGEVVASVPGAGALRIGVGARLLVKVPTLQSPVKVLVTVVGLYRPFSSDGDYWYGTHYSAPSGIKVTSNAASDHARVVDAMFGTRSFMMSTSTALADLPTPVSVQSTVTVPLRTGRVGLTDLPVLRRALATLQSGQVAGHPVQLTTALPAFLDQIDAGRRDARRVVLPAALALALLATLAFGVVVAAAADQRRPEFALARLRGNSSGRSAQLFAREIAVLVLAAVPVGLAIAWGLTVLVSHVALVPGVRAELRWPVLGTTAGALLVMIAIVALIGRRANGQQITDMLRQLPARSSRVGLGVAEAGVVVAAVAGLLASVGSSRRTNALAALTLTLVAVVVGLLVSRLLVAVARRVGGRALWRGSLVTAVAALTIARRPGGRLTVTVLCVATALLVFAGQQWDVAAVNRDQRAGAEIGAAVALDVSTPSAARLAAAVRAGDPSRRYATPVVVVDPPGIDAVPTVAVDPASFGAVASWGRPAERPSAAELRRLLPPHVAAPVTFTGDTLRLRLAASSYNVLVSDGTNVPASVSLRLDLRRADGQPVQATFKPLPTQDAGALSLSAPVLCDDGCRLTGIEFARPILDQNSVDVSVTVSGLDAGGTALPIGRAADWQSTTPRARVDQTPDHTSMTAVDTAAGLRFHAFDDGSGTSMHYLETPVGLPALLAGPRPNTIDSIGYLTGATLDGGTGRLTLVGSLPFVPQVGPAALVDLDLAEAASTRLDAVAHPQVWLATDEPGRERLLVTALHRAGIDVVHRQSSAHRSGTYTRSATGWSALFALVVGVLAMVVALGLLTLVVLTSRRVRQRDLAAMRLSGLDAGRVRASSAAELVVLVVVGIGAGAVAGLVGVRLSLPAIPIFIGPASVALPPAFGLRIGWLAGLLAASVLVLVAVAAVLGARVAARATPDTAVGEPA